MAFPEFEQYLNKMVTVKTMHCHKGHFRRLGEANDELLRKHSSGHPERFSVPGGEG